MARSRTGCANCKRRKRKCDEERPGCRACKERGVQCEGYVQTLRWDNGVASRGRLAGARVPDQAAASAAARPDLARTTFREPGDSDSAIHSAETPKSAAASHSPGLLLADSPSSVYTSNTAGSTRGELSSPASQSDTQAQLFNQFLTSGLLRLYATEAQTWIQPFFRELSGESRALVQVCAAIQAYVNDRQRALSLSSMEYVDHALQDFRTELASRDKTMHVATACAGLLLCTLLLLQGRPWAFQLDLMADLYQLPAAIPEMDPGPEHDRGILHVLEVMGVMDLPSLVVGRAKASIGIWKRLRESQETWEGGRVGGVEIVSGMPRSLLDILAGIRDNDKEYTEKRLLRWPGHVGNYLQCYLWDCWRLSAVLEVRRRQRHRQHMARRGSSVPSNTAALAGRQRDDPPTEIVMCQLMASMDSLYRAMDLPCNSHLLMRKGLLFPLMTSALEGAELRNHPEWKATIEEILEYFVRTDDLNLTLVTAELVKEALSEGSGFFDYDEAARRKGVEVAIF